MVEMAGSIRRVAVTLVDRGPECAHVYDDDGTLLEVRFRRGHREHDEAWRALVERIANETLPRAGGYRWLTVPELAVELTISERSVRRNVQMGLWPCHWVGKRSRFSPEDVLAIKGLRAGQRYRYDHREEDMTT